MAPTTTTSASCEAISLESICSLEDVFHRHLLPFLSHQDAGRLESVSQTLRSSLQAHHFEAWKLLCDRDFRGSATTPSAPVYSVEHESFSDICPQETWKQAYQKWSFWTNYTAGGATAQHMMLAVKLWKNYKALLAEMGMHNILESLSPCLSRGSFRQLVEKQIPSSLIAFYSVHGGQLPLRPRSQDHEFFAGVFGSYSCYNNFYSMRLSNMEDFIDNATSLPSMTLIGISPGNPRMFLYLASTTFFNEGNINNNYSYSHDPEGTIVMVHNNPLSSQSIQAQHATVGSGGILSYFQSFLERLQDGTYKPCQVIPESPSSRGLGLFPDAGDQVSVCVTRGIEVKASARWFPGGIMDQVTGGGMNFGYSVRIQKVIPEDNDNNNDNIPETCQLVGRHLEFMNGNGNVRRVDGDGVIGKQPLFFLENGKSGFVDLGIGGDGRRYNDELFVYQSQSGPVEGTSRQDTGSASVSGTFSFVPGSIDNPTGPMFHVTVGKFPFQVPFPFY